MRLVIVLGLMICVPLLSMTQQKSRKLFPYKYSIGDLPNGLRLITIPTDYPNLVALYIVVATGSRNEIEPGKSGYAHLFEHLMFRGSEHYSSRQRDEILKLAGADSNAYTSDDRTVYHEVFSKDDLDRILELEADRFQHLKYGPDDYKTETRAVLGEYNKDSADPESKLYEVLRATAFKQHTYSHTTMGFIEDIEDMPNQFDYSWEFYKRYYRPEHTTIVIAGDMQHERALELVKKYFGDWKRGDYVLQIPLEPDQKGPRQAHVPWPSETLPLIYVAFRGPAYSDEKKDKAALDLLAPIGFGENSDLYQKLVLKEQKVESLDYSFPHRMDSELFLVIAKVKDEKDMDYVQQQILETFKRYTAELITQGKLDSTRSHLRYGFALSLDSSEAIAAALAQYVALRRTPETIDKLYALYDTITPEDIRSIASRYFVPDNRTIAMLTTRKDGKEGANR
jgi:zinc protease